MARPKSAVLRAERELRTLVHELHEHDDVVLPSLRRLARQMHISAGTVLKAMQRLQREGLVMELPYRGYAVAGLTSPTPPPPPQPPPVVVPSCTPALTWQSVAYELRRDIIEDRFGADTALPSSKELRTRYGCGHPTLQRALRCLYDEGRLTHHGRYYKIRKAMPLPPSATIVFASFETNPSRYTRTTPHSPELWRNLERECHRRRLGLTVRPFATVAAKPHVEQSALVGYVVSTLTSDPALRDSALRAALSTRLPVALLDETGESAALMRRHASPLLRCFSMGTGAGCGRLVGEYLASRGHRRVVFIAPRDANLERTRWAGVCQPFEQIGLDNAVAFRTLGIPASHDIEREPHLLAFRARVADAAARYARRTQYGGDPGPVMVPPVSLRFAASMLASRLARPFCLATLRAEPATAWVAFSDEIALLLLEQLRATGVRLPLDLSLVGFDDTLEGFGKSLSSYSFNIPAIVNALLDHLLAPKRTGPHSPMVEIPGMVLERETSGRLSTDRRTRSGDQPVE